MNPMTKNSLTHWPAYAPISLKFDKIKLFNEIKQSGILNNKKLTTPLSVDGKNFWDNGVNFKSEKFKKQTEVPLWDTTDETITLNKKDIDTYYEVNVTTPYPAQNDLTPSDVWLIGTEYKSSKPLWIVNNHSWLYRTDFDLPYLKLIVNQLSLDYVSALRIIHQQPPSIGAIHRDSGPVTNATYFKNGGVSITLGVASGGANLYFIDSQGNERTIDEENVSVWHFDDAKLHCTNEVTSERIQIRIYGKHRSYKDLMILDKRID